MVEMDPWEKVRAALEDPNWDFRSIDGIAKETKLDPIEVEAAISRNMSKVRRARSREGENLYTLDSRPMRAREVMALMQRLASKSL